MEELDIDDIAYLMERGFEPVVSIPKPTKEQMNNRQVTVNIYMCKFDKSNPQ